VSTHALTSTSRQRRGLRSGAIEGTSQVKNPRARTGGKQQSPVLRKLHRDCAETRTSELRIYLLHLFRLLSMLSCLWETLFLLPRWMACLLTVGEFPFQGDRSAEPRSSVACDSVLDFSGAAMLVASRGMGNL